MKTAQEYIEERSFFDAVKVLYEVPEAERDALWNYRMGYALYFFAINRYPKLCVLRLALSHLERADEDTASKAEISSKKSPLFFIFLIIFIFICYLLLLFFRYVYNIFYHFF